MSRSRKSPHQDRAPLACYANYFEIGHNEHEFLIKFCQYQPETTDFSLVSNIVLAPIFGKVLHDMLHDALAKYESAHGALQPLNGAPNALQALLRSVPDFEQRALSARLRRLQGTNSPKRNSRKR